MVGKQVIYINILWARIYADHMVMNLITVNFKSTLWEVHSLLVSPYYGATSIQPPLS